MVSNRTHAVHAIRFWAREVGRASRVPEIVKYYEENFPGFLENLGKATRSIRQGKVIEAMEVVAQENFLILHPDPQDFFNALAKEAATINFFDVKQSAREAATSVQDFAKSKLIPVLLIGAGAFIFLQIASPMLLKRAKA